MKKLKTTIIICIISFLCVGSVSIFNLSVNHKSTVVEADQLQNITAYNAVKSITLSQSVLNLKEGKKGSVSATITRDKNSSLKAEPISWSTKNNNIATVSQSGIVQAKQSGVTYIICSSKLSGIKARCKIIVNKPYNAVKTIALNRNKIQLNKGDKRSLTPIIKYSSNKVAYPNEEILWSSSNNKIASVNKKGVVKGVSNGDAYITVKSKYTNKTAKCKVTVKKTKYVAITFDDGPSQYTNKLLNALEKYNSKVTFFVLGNMTNIHRKEIKRESDLYMEIGSHTYNHLNLKTLSKKKIISEIQRTNKLVKSLTGAAPTLLRPPYGNFNKTVSKNAGVPMIYWSVDTEDWKHRNVNYVYKTLLKQCGDGDIVLLHDSHPTSVDGFIKALPTLRKKGFELVTVTELYQIKGHSLKSGIMHYGPKYDKTRQ